MFVTCTGVLRWTFNHFLAQEKFQCYWRTEIIITIYLMYLWFLDDWTHLLPVTRIIRFITFCKRNTITVLTMREICCICASICRSWEILQKGNQVHISEGKYMAACIKAVEAWVSYLLLIIPCWYSKLVMRKESAF